MKIDCWMGAVCISTILSGRALGCFCLSIPMCSQIGTLPQSSVVFVGRVIEIWPAREVLAREEPQHLSLAQLRHLILKRWHGVLSAEEERYIRTSSDRDAIEIRYAFIQRVRFVITEGFAGPPAREIYTNSTSCGYRFELDRDYLVDAVCDGSRCHTGACSRTGRVESDNAIQDLKALRARKSGTPLLPRIYGRIPSEDLGPDIRVQVINDREEKSVRLGTDGSFSFDRLANTQYRLQVQDGRGNGERVIDLSRQSCFEATPFFDGAWHIAGSPTLLELLPN